MVLDYHVFMLKLKQKEAGSFGLNSYEYRIWTALLSRGTSTAGELSDIADVPRSRSYDVLESLEKKGFVVMKLGKPIKYIAVSPKEVVERVKKNVAEDAKDQIKKLTDLKSTDVLTELDSLHSQGVKLVEPSDLSGSLRGRHNLYNHLELLIKNANESVTLMTTSQGLLRKLEGLKPTFEKIKKKGVKIRIAAPVTKESLNLMKDLGNLVEVRHTDNKARFCIVDGKELVFMVLDDNEVHPAYDVGIWVSSPLIKSFEERFILLWNGMKKPGEIL